MIYVLQMIQVLFLLIAGFFSIETVLTLYRIRHSTPQARLKKPVYLFLMVGMISLAIAYSMKHIYSYIFGEIVPLVSDLFFVISYITLIVAFAMFWVDTKRIGRFGKKEIFFIIGVIAMITIWAVYLFVEIMSPGISDLPMLNVYLHYFYPAAASFLFVSTLIIYPSYRSGHIKSPLYYMSAGVFLNFLGEMIYLYNRWNFPSKYLEYGHSVIFMISAFYFAIAFYAAYRKWKKA